MSQKILFSLFYWLWQENSFSKDSFNQLKFYIEKRQQQQQQLSNKNIFLFRKVLLKIRSNQDIDKTMKQKLQQLFSIIASDFSSQTQPRSRSISISRSRSPKIDASIKTQQNTQIPNPQQQIVTTQKKEQHEKSKQISQLLMKKKKNENLKDTSKTCRCGMQELQLQDMRVGENRENREAPKEGKQVLRVFQVSSENNVEMLVKQAVSMLNGGGGVLKVCLKKQVNAANIKNKISPFKQLKIQFLKSQISPQNFDISLIWSFILGAHCIFLQLKPKFDIDNKLFVYTNCGDQKTRQPASPIRTCTCFADLIGIFDPVAQPPPSVLLLIINHMSAVKKSIISKIVDWFDSQKKRYYLQQVNMPFSHRQRGSLLEFWRIDSLANELQLQNCLKEESENFVYEALENEKNKIMILECSRTITIKSKLEEDISIFMSCFTKIFGKEIQISKGNQQYNEKQMAVFDWLFKFETFEESIFTAIYFWRFLNRQGKQANEVVFSDKQTHRQTK